MFNVVIVEDHRETASLLCRYIQELPRLLTVPSTLDGPVEERPRNPKFTDFFDDTHYEPGQGQLVHLRHLFDYLERCKRNDSEWPEIPADPLERFPAVHIYPIEDLSELVKIARTFQPAYGHKIESGRDGCAELQAALTRFRDTVDVLVVDLAMTRDEVEAMVAAGAEDAFDPASPAPLRDPRPKLRELTGFKLLRAFAREMPVVVTAFWPNPLVRQHCRVNGAFAYVQKPILTRSEANNFDFESAVSIGVVPMDKSAKINASPLDVVVVEYLTDAAAEVVKALLASWITKQE